MITAFTASGGRLSKLETSDPFAEATRGQVLWIDLVEPTPEEDKAVEAAFGVSIPTREDMEEIEVSSRIYVEDGAAFMTVLLPANADTSTHDIRPVSFILSGNLLVTVRFHKPRAFETFAERAAKVNTGCVDADTVLIGLLDAVIDRVADILERTGQEIDLVSKEVFHRDTEKGGKTRDFEKILQTLGKKADLLSGIRDSLATLQRMFGFLGQLVVKRGSDKDARASVKTLGRDAASLIDHSSFLSQKVVFLLDATLGMISIEQNAIIKIFSVAAVIFLPPTLVASVYGMNFEHMPELDWLLGYPAALGVMVLSAVLPYLFFKRRGWL